MTYDSEIIKEIESDKDIILVENNAQTIYDHISELEKDKTNNEKRWFWELLQNAKDSVDEHETVSVKVSLNEQKLIFSHTGNPFQRKDILHLIFHGSSKKKSEGKTGRFGTGFMTTHLLSKRVTIKGKLETGEYFNFLLDRNAKDYIEQKDSLDKSYDRFKESINIVNPFDSDFKTEFIFELNDDGEKIAKTGLAMLPSILPVVLAFNHKIKSIVTDSFEIIKEDISEEIQTGSIKLNRHKIKTAGEEYLQVVTYDTPDYNIAIILEKVEQHWQIKNISEKYPKLFFDFPLFGTEKIGIPFILNSLKFDPRRERDGIFLGESNDEKIKQNKKIIESAFNDFKNVVEYFGQQQTKNIHSLVLFQLPSDYSWLDRTWYLSQLKNLIQKLIYAKCLYVISNLETNTISLSECKIPFAKSKNEVNQLFPSVQALFTDSTVDLLLLDAWIEVINRFAMITETQVESYEFIVTKEKVCKILDEAGGVEKLKEKHFNNETLISATFNWVNSFLQILSDEELLRYSLNYRIIPNQKSFFVKRTADSPKIDVSLDNDLKSIAEQYSWFIKDELIHESIKLLNKNFESLDQEKVLDELERINRKISPDKLDEKTKNGFIMHLRWLIKHKEDARIKVIYVFVNDKSELNQVLQTRQLFIDEGRKLLIPQLFWDLKFSNYSDLVQEKYIMNEDYSKELTSDDFKFISDLNIVYAQPLIIRKRKANKNDLKLLLSNSESMVTLCDENSELKNFDIEFSDIPYFTTSDDNILSKTSGSIKAAKSLLRFILLQVLKEDLLFNTSSQIETINYTKSIWAARLRENKWVPFKTITEENPSISSEKPSTVNIGALMAKDEELLKTLNNLQVAIFFNSLGISIADIIRNLIPDADQKLQWDLTFSKLLTNKNIDPKLAQEMLEDPSLQEIYLKRKKDRELIQRNQNIGYTFEKVFKKIFESVEMQNLGLKIVRTGLGSDYALVESDFTVENKEVIFQVGSILIELKASGKPYTEMTPLQGQTAVLNAKQFILAVLPLANYAIDEDNVKNHVRFVTNIGSVLKPHFDSFQSYNKEKNCAIADSDQARLSIEDGDVRYQVKSVLWEQSSLPFLEFMNWLKINATVKTPNMPTIGINLTT